MTPEERQLIAGLFDRMRSYGAPEKDREAEALINQSVRANPDAPYMLVQSVLVQEQALQASQQPRPGPRGAAARAGGRARAPRLALGRLPRRCLGRRPAARSRRSQRAADRRARDAVGLREPARPGRKAACAPQPSRSTPQQAPAASAAAS